MDKNTVIKVIEELAIRAKSAHDANDALKFSQSALNLSHAVATLYNME